MNDTATLTIERVFDAPVELVWKAWTTPEHFMQWYGPKGFTTPVCTMDFQVGGKYLSCMLSPGGDKYWNTGIYQEIIPLERIVYTAALSDEQGNEVPDSETQITLLFEAQDTKTKLTLHHAGLPVGAGSEQAGAGWNQSLDKLSETLIKERAG